jgi:hypothetical protein
MLRVRKQGRQGDVLVTRITALPGNCADIPPNGDWVLLAFGEQTGHAHMMSAAQTRQFDYFGRTFIDVIGVDPEPLYHEEHETLLLEPGLYEVRRQKQYSDSPDEAGLNELRRQKKRSGSRPSRRRSNVDD